MKLFIRKLFLLYFCFIANTHASMVTIYVEVKKDLSYAYSIKKHFKDKFLVPEQLVHVAASVRNCEKLKKENTLKICINKKGELNILSSSIENIKKSILSFK